MAPYLVDPASVHADLWLGGSYELTLDPRMATTGDRLPWPVGHVRHKERRQREVVHDCKGPACSPRWPGVGAA
eukprot:1229204-Alexandrium_andersonii.AAC.1